MAFSPDFTRLYVSVGSDSLAIVDALGYFRLSAMRIGLPGAGVAATSQAIYVTHPASDSVSVISSSDNILIGRISVGARPSGATATADRAFFAVRGDRRIAIVDAGGDKVAIPLAGEPRDVVVSRDGRRLFATVDVGAGAWRLAIAAPGIPDTLQSLALSSRPGAITTDLSGERAYILLPAEARVAVVAEGAGGVYAEVGSVPVGAGAGGISARLTGAPLVVVSGDPVMIFDGSTLAVLESIPDVGAGNVAVRPDGFFAFISVVGSNVLRVVGL
jgi:DNA-binding beta-propeller fold protein YncE